MSIDCGKMKKELKKYLIISAIGHVFMVAVLTPWMLFLIQVTYTQYITWLWQGSLLAFVLPYGTIKVSNWGYQKITRQKL